MELLLLTAATAADIFAASLGLGASGIKFPVLSAAAAAFAGAAAMCLTAILSAGADKLFPLDGAVYISKSILLLMGLYSVFGENAARRRGKKSGKGTGHYNFADAVNDPAVSDRDHSKTISAAEGAALGLALSGDSFLAGVSAGIAGMAPPRILITAFIFGMAAVFSGVRIGRLISGHTDKFRAGAVSGVILIILAVIL